MARTTVTLLLLSVALCMTGVAWAQYGTPNLPSATPLQGDTYDVKAEARIWDEDNQTWALTVRGANSDDADVSIGYFDWDVTGDKEIAGAVRRSDYQAVVVDLKWMFLHGNPGAARRAGADLQLGNSRGINTNTRAAAFSDGAIPAVSIPIEFTVGDSTMLFLEPKIVWFDTMLPTTLDGSIPGFGSLVIVGGGVRYDTGARVDVVADAAYPLSDYNTVDDVTNAVDKDLVWSAGISHTFGDENNWMLDVFATNAAGPTPATSSIATPDQSIGVGVRVGGSW